MRIPPQATDIERSVIGSMLLETESVDEAIDVVVREDFYSPQNGNAFEACKNLRLNGRPVDQITVEEELRSMDVPAPDLSTFATDACTSTQVKGYCEVIREKSVLRQLIRFCNDSVERSYNPDADPITISDDLSAKLMDVVDTGSETFHRIDETLHSLSERIRRIQESGEPIGLMTGLDIDEILRGFQEAKLYILGARPSMGKTAFVMTVMRELARKDKGTGIISLETSNQSLGVRLVAQASGIPAEKILSGRMNAGEMDRYEKACHELSRHKMFIDDATGITGQQLYSKCVKMKKEGAEIVFIDFLTLVKTEGRSRHEEVGQITKICKNIAKDLNMPIVMLSQLSRKVEDRNNKRPMLSDLRESGSIEEDADVILFLYRDEYYGVKKTPEGESTDGLAEVIVAKNKDGRTGVKKLLFEKETMTFKNLTRSEAPF